MIVKEQIIEQTNNLKMKSKLSIKLPFAVLMLLLFAFSINVNAQGLSGDTWSKTLGNKKGRIVITHSWAPKFSEGSKGQYSGLCYAVMNDFIAYVGTKYGVALKVQYHDLPDDKNFSAFLMLVKSSKGGVFGLGDVTITEERKSVLNFSDPYFENIAILATHKSIANLTALDNIKNEFNGMAAVVQKGTTHEARMYDVRKKHFPNLMIKTTTSYLEANKFVETNPIAFTYMDLSTYLDVIQTGVKIKRHEVADQTGEQFGFIMPKNSDWTPIFNEFMRADGGYIKSMKFKKHLTEQLGSHVVRLISALNNS